MFRNLVAFSDFITMAAISFTRSVGIVCGSRFKHRKSFASSKSAICSCLLIWLLSFAINSPAIFQISLLGYSFGTFGYDAKLGYCQTVDCDFKGLQPGGVIYVYGVLIPLIIILSSNIVLSLFVKREMEEITRESTSQVVGLTNIFTANRKQAILNRDITAFFNEVSLHSQNT